MTVASKALTPIFIKEKEETQTDVTPKSWTV